MKKTISSSRSGFQIGRLLREAGEETGRAFNRLTEEMNTRNNLFKKARSLRETPVSGDTIARVSRG